MAQKQIDIEKQLATMRAKIAELERQNRELAAIIRLKDEHIADLLKDGEFNNSFIERLLGILEVVYCGGNYTEEKGKKQKPAKSKIVKLNPQPLSGQS